MLWLAQVCIEVCNCYTTIVVASLLVVGVIAVDAAVVVDDVAAAVAEVPCYWESRSLSVV